ncbi:MAG: uroporphyrinogen decarboxylase family protein [Armatimonadia bacterium]
MTSRERVVTALRRQQPDRVPVMCQLSIGHYLVNLDLDPAEYWLSNELIAKAYVELAWRYHFDGILVNLPGRTPDAAAYVESIERIPTGQVIHYRDGSECKCPVADLPTQVSGEQPSLEEIDPGLLYYEDPHTLGGLKYPFHYDFERGDDYFPEYLFALIDRVVETVAGELSVHGEVFSPFTQLMERLGYEQGLMALLEQPAKCKAILAQFARGAADLATRQASRGVDAVLISSAFAGGGFISRAMYEEFVLPYEDEVAAAIHRAGTVAYTHTCGAIGDRLEFMAATGIDGIDTMDPPPLGDTDLADAKARVGGKLFLKGNIDSVNVLLRGTPEEVRRSALSRIQAAAAGGGYILSSACSVAPRVPPENLQVLYDVASTEGLY